jgi:hypothetical protein
MPTSFPKKIELLAEFYNRNSDNPDFFDLFRRADLSFPLASMKELGILDSPVIMEALIDSGFRALLSELKLSEESEYNELWEIWESEEEEED